MTNIKYKINGLTYKWYELNAKHVDPRTVEKCLQFIKYTKMTSQGRMRSTHFCTEFICLDNDPLYGSNEPDVFYVKAI